MKLGKIQKTVLDYIAKTPGTLSEIATAMNMKETAVEKTLEALDNKNLISTKLVYTAAVTPADPF